MTVKEPEKPPAVPSVAGGGILNTSFWNTESDASNGPAIEMSVKGGDADADQDAWTSDRSGSLIYTRVQKLPTRDFYREVRPMLDVEHYVYDMTVILDADQISTKDIVMQLLWHIFPEDSLRESGIADDCKKLLFADRDHILLADVLQAATGYESNPFLMDPNWLIAMCDLPLIKKRRIGMARLKHPVNFGPAAESVRFFALVIGATEEKATKSSVETARTLATLLSDIGLRHELRYATDANSFREALVNKSMQLASPVAAKALERESLFSCGSHLLENIVRRGKYYVSDYVDGMDSMRTISKVLSTSVFLFFSIILPTVAFGALGSRNTGGKINENRAVVGQVVGGMIWSLVSGQPMLVIATTALVSLYSKVVYEASLALDEDFYTVYAWVGMWSTFFLLIYAFTGIGNLVKFSTRSVEEIFSSFITICFVVDAVKDMVAVFSQRYKDLDLNQTMTTGNISIPDWEQLDGKSTCLASFLLMALTVSASVSVANFRTSPFLVPAVRETISDYALPIGVIVMSLLGHHSKVFLDVLGVEGFTALTPASLQTSGRVMGVTFALGFAASILFFMDQNITSQILNAPNNRLLKGAAPHLDILVIGIVNLILSLYGLPWMHAVLPHSPLHVVCLADTEERVVDGQSRQVVLKARETRVTGILCHLLMILVLAACPFLFSYIPIPVLDGLFLYCAVMSLRGNSFFERLLLLFTQQSQYPPAHYVRQCPQALVHWFTFLEVIQLLVVCFIGFGPWTFLQMLFPLALAVLIPVRHLLVPYFIDTKYLPALESFD